MLAIWFSITMHRRGSDSTSLLSSSGEITRNQAAMTCSISSLFVFGLFIPIMQLTRYHKFSMGLNQEIGLANPCSILGSCTTLDSCLDGGMEHYRLIQSFGKQRTCMGNILFSSTSIICPDHPRHHFEPTNTSHATPYHNSCLMVGVQ